VDEGHTLLLLSIVADGDPRCRIESYLWKRPYIAVKVGITVGYLFFLAYKKQK
jgi:hypothetical protein